MDDGLPGAGASLELRTENAGFLDFCIELAVGFIATKGAFECDRAFAAPLALMVSTLATCGALDLGPAAIMASTCWSNSASKSGISLTLSCICLSTSLSYRAHFSSYSLKDDGTPCSSIGSARYISSQPLHMLAPLN